MAHDNFKLDETGDEFSKRVEITVEKGEIAPCDVHTQLLLALYMCVFILNGFPRGYF